MLQDKNGKEVKIDLTMTCTHRPEILERTLTSFRDNLFGGDYMKEGIQLYANVDQVGSDEDMYWEVLEVLQGFFSKLVVNRSRRAHFPTAFNWCWLMVSKSDSQFVFNLEEDWELLRKYDFQEMVQIMIDNPDIAHLRFSIFKSAEMTCKNWKYFFKWNGYMFECPEIQIGAVGWCGHPSLNNAKFVRSVFPHFDVEKNIEKQIKGHHPEIGHILMNWKFGCYTEQSSLPNIRDIGRQWMVDHGYQKKGKNKEWFTEWEEVIKIKEE